MIYAILDENNVIVNVIIVDDPEYAEFIQALPLKNGQGIGDIYEFPETETKTESEPIEKIMDAFIQ